MLTLPMGVANLIPSLGWLRTYSRAWLRPDITAGLTAAAVVVPKAMAFATIAQLPLHIGLYTAIVPMVVYAILGSSRPLSVSTTTTIAILTATELGLAAPGGDAAALMTAAAMLAVLVGILLLLASVFRLGFVANFISDPVLTGFKSGIGLVIVVDQLPKLLGVQIPNAGFFRDLAAVAQQLPETSGPTLLMGVAVIAIVVGLESVLPRVPAPPVAIGLAIAASAVLGLEAMGVATVGTVQGELPHLVLPTVALVGAMWPAAAGIALMSFAESIAAARAFGAPGEPRPEPNRELFALGASNIAGGLFGTMPAGGGTSQTAVNHLAGAKSQMATLVTAAAALSILLLLGPVIARMPQAALAAVVVFYTRDLIKPAEFFAIRRVRHIEFRWAVAACAGVVLLGTLEGILVAVILSLVSLAQQAHNPPVYVLGRKRGTTAFRARMPRHPDDETWPGLLILRLEGRLFFANAERVFDRVREQLDREQPRVLLLDCRAILDIEYTALRMLIDAEERLRAGGISLWLAGLNPEVLDVVRRSALGERLGHERMFFNLDAAVRAFEPQHVA